MIAFMSSRLMRNDPGGIGVESLTSSGVFDERIWVPPSSVMLVSDRSATVRSPRGIAAGGALADSDGIRSGPNCTDISRKSAPSRVRYIRELSTETFKCNFLSNFACRLASSIAIRSLFDTEQKYRVEHSRELQRLMHDTRASHTVPVSR